MVTHAQALLSLMNLPEDTKVQLMYLRLSTGKVCMFIGAPMTEDEFNQVEGIALGERLSPLSLTLATAFEAGTTAQ